MSKKNHYQKQKPQEKLDGTEIEGLIIGHYGTNVLVENSQSEKIRCHLRKNMEPCIPGDRILYRMQNNEGIVVQILPRDSLFYRVDRNKQKLIAANVDAIVIVTAPPPLLSMQLLDSYLIACESVEIQPIILLNKIDLLDETTLSDIKKELACYEKIGYPVIYSTILLENGLAELSSILRDKTSVLVGASGVGKSSIIATLTESQHIMIGETSAHGGLGKHTTTTTHLYHLPTGGNLIDSPGVREFTLWHLPPDEMLKCFIEFKDFADSCKFRNCSHQSEPGCEVLKALDQGHISISRYQNYLKLLN